MFFEAFVVLLTCDFPKLRKKKSQFGNGIIRLNPRLTEVFQCLWPWVHNFSCMPMSVFVVSVLSPLCCHHCQHRQRSPLLCSLLNTENLSSAQFFLHFPRALLSAYKKGVSETSLPNLCSLFPTHVLFPVIYRSWGNPPKV